jgi:hypothetical protein
MTNVFAVVWGEIRQLAYFDTVSEAAIFAASHGGEVRYRKIAPPHISTFDELKRALQRLDRETVARYGKSRNLSVELSLTGRGIELQFPDGSVVWSVGRPSSRGTYVKTFDLYAWATEEIDRKAKARTARGKAAPSVAISPWSATERV